jgi:GNAT superfamily N-acetyltransferase
VSTATREWLRDLAECPPAPEPPTGSASSRIVTDRYIAEIGPEPDPDMNVVSRLRLEGSDLAAVLEEVRASYRAAGRRAATWEVASGSTPSGLEATLRTLGMETNETAWMLALACTTEPASPTEGVTVEEAASDSQLAEVRVIFEAADGWTPGDAWLRGPGFVTRYLARIDGEAVATADITWLDDDRAVFLGGALTLPSRRGRGAYRALVHARWRAAAARGRDVLVTQSEPMSQPILLRLGFEVVGEIHVLLDRF